MEVGVRSRQAVVSSGLTALTFTITTFVNAALLFTVEPMFSKMALPLLGGTPGVWNTCMLFFQTALLAGYAYAHVVTTRLAPRTQAAVHLTLLAVSLVSLPISIAAAFRSPHPDAPVASLIALLAVSLGAPFLMLSSGAPLLQRWFSRTGHPSAANPYFLYAASNLGSMIALLAYPALLERTLTLSTQSRVWSACYVALIGLVGACAALARNRHASTAVAPTASDVSAGHLTMVRRLRWVLLAFVPSSMLLGVTTYLSTDVAAIPLLWVLPLAIYLLTFVIAFSSREWFRPKLVLGLQAVFLVWLTMSMSAGLSSLVSVMAPAHLSLLFLSALVCHSALAADRPPVARLTEFYLWISFGGMLGGVFNVLIAPSVFTAVVEYPIAIVLAAAVRPGNVAAGGSRAWRLDVLLPAALALLLAVLLRDGLPIPGLSFRVSLGVFVAVAFTCLAFYRRPVRFALSLALFFAVAGMSLRGKDERLLRRRSFFGVYTVTRIGDFRTLQHGTTTHGAQSVDPDEALEPLTYYHRLGPIAQVLTTIGGDAPRRVAVIGLGTGSLACYGRPDESWTFYEIDPLVERIARDPKYFTYMRDCPPAKRVILGDARLSLANAPSGSYDILVVDAFTSDAIPTHLITRQALQLYLDKLGPSGVVAFHISNRYLDLEPVVAGIARSVGASALVGSDTYLSAEERGPFRNLSKWVAISRSRATIAPLQSTRGWRELEPSQGAPWTDDFTNVLGVFHWR
jgi:spermidine synthase